MIKKKKSKAISGEPSKIGLIFKNFNLWNPRHVFNQEAQTQIN
jgi:ABC-type histidine transport system ATPase subunit